MKEILKKRWKFIVLLFTIFIIVIPLLINILFKTYTDLFIFQAEWNAGDALGFYGCVLGGLLTVYGVFLTIKFTQANYRDDVRNRVLPFITLNIFDTKSHFYLLQTKTVEDVKDHKNSYDEYQQENVYYVIEKGIPIEKSNLNDEQQDTVENGGLKKMNNTSDSYLLGKTEFIYLPCELCNVGNGTAINLRIGFNCKGSLNKHYLKPRPFYIKQTFKLNIYAEDYNDIEGEYLMECYYEDISSNKYRQVFTVNITKDILQNIEETIGSIKAYPIVDFNGKQERITEEEYFG